MFFSRLLANWKCPSVRRFQIFYHQIIANLQQKATEVEK